VVVANPPQSMRADRAAADALPDEARRRWYLSANVEAARQARAHQDAGRAVVMDRSLASTLAFGAAERAEVAEGADWPPELPRPDYLLLLNVSEPERRRRLLGRDGELTAEERRLLVDHACRERVLCGYRRLGALGVPADGDPAEILASIERLLRRTPSS
jgi:thymidylate kinase